jgi:hypothetical protein
MVAGFEQTTRWNSYQPPDKDTEPFSRNDKDAACSDVSEDEGTTEDVAKLEPRDERIAPITIAAIVWHTCVARKKAIEAKP